jgi:acyl carrier protein
MLPDRDTIIAELKARLVSLARGLGRDAAAIGEDDVIPDADVLDSAGLLEFVVWYDERYGLSLAPEDMTVDNLGSLGLMADFALGRLRARTP